MGVMTISLTDATETKLRDYRKTLPVQPPISHMIEQAILDYLAKKKK